MMAAWGIILYAAGFIVSDNAAKMDQLNKQRQYFLIAGLLKTFGFVIVIIALIMWCL